METTDSKYYARSNQVCSLVSTDGYGSMSGQNQICIWSYLRMDMVMTLAGHTHWVLYLAMSPDGQAIITGAGDETLRFWNAFPRAQERRTGHAGAGKGILAGIGIGGGEGEGVVR